jgi:mitotic spindle assembly checkpoint protein MAD2
LPALFVEPPTQKQTQFSEWLAKNEIEKISMIITNANTKETIECWDFKVHSEAGDGSSTKNPTSSKDLKKIQGEIRDVMRQIAATVSYLPLLECICSFDVLIYMREPECEVPKEWANAEEVHIKNAQQVQLKTFSTGLHKVDTIVNYKMTD